MFTAEFEKTAKQRTGIIRMGDIGQSIYDMFTGGSSDKPHKSKKRKKRKK